MDKIRKITYADWIIEGERLFGKDKNNWQFVCPSCGYVQSQKDFIKLGVDRPELKTGYSCIGRYDGVHEDVPMGKRPGPCNYTTGGLFNISPLRVKLPDVDKEVYMFDFYRGETH